MFKNFFLKLKLNLKLKLMPFIKKILSTSSLINIKLCRLGININLIIVILLLYEFFIINCLYIFKFSMLFFDTIFFIIKKDIKKLLINFYVFLLIIVITVLLKYIGSYVYLWPFFFIKVYVYDFILYIPKNKNDKDLKFYDIKNLQGVLVFYYSFLNNKISNLMCSVVKSLKKYQ